MTRTMIVAQLVTADGANVRRWVSSDPERMWNPLRRESWCVPAREVRSVQPATIPVAFGAHGGPVIGHVTHMERAPNEALWCVADIDDDVQPARDTDWFLSVEATHTADGRDVEVTGAALCERSRMIGLQPVTFVRSGIDQHGRRVTGFHAELIEHAKAARRYRRGQIVVWGSTPAIEQRVSGEAAYVAAAEGQWSAPTVRLEHAPPVRGSVLRVR